MQAYQTLRQSTIGLNESSDDIIMSLIFHDIPKYMHELLFQDELLLENKKNDAEIYFFNEHSVVKPPNTNVEFRWHQVYTYIKHI